MNEITALILEQKLWECKGKTPQATVAAQIFSDVKKHETLFRAGY